MSESPDVCQFSSTEAISQHCYNVSASNWVQRFFKGLGTFAFTNYVPFSSYFFIFLCNFEVITGFILLLTVTCNIRQWTTIFAYQTGCQRRQCRFLIVLSWAITSLSLCTSLYFLNAIAWMELLMLDKMIKLALLGFSRGLGMYKHHRPDQVLNSLI